MSQSDGYGHIRRHRSARKPRSLEDWLAAYVSLRRALGFRALYESSLGTLVTFMRQRGITSFRDLNREAASEWLRSGSPLESTIGNRFVAAKGLFQYLSSLAAVDTNIWNTLSPPRCKKFIPHVYSLGELQLIMDHLRQRTDPRNPKRSRAYSARHVIFHTLYACGFRAGEACRLALGDVDFARSLFVVKNTKFGKTRLVPFNSRTGELLREYLTEHRGSMGTMEPEAPLFINYRGKAFSVHMLREHCVHVCASLGVLRRREVRENTVSGSSNLHAFRHTFAVHRLLKWYYEGIDINAKLPALATYMGHASYRHTQCYLTVLPMFIDIAGKLFSDKFETQLFALEKNLQ